MSDQDFVLSDEQIAEQETQAVAEGAEFRAKIVSELGLVEDDTNKGFIDKVVEREAGLRKGFGKLLGNYKKLKSTVKPPQQSQQQQPQPLDAETIRKQTEDTVNQQLEQRDLNEMDYPDEIKEQIKTVAKIKNVSVRQAAKDPYIQHLVSQAIAEGRVQEAAIPRTQTSTSSAKPLDTTKPEFDMSTPEGRKAFQDSKKSRHGKK